MKRATSQIQRERYVNHILRNVVAMEHLAEARGVGLTKHGADLHGHCPFHEDRTPSLVITPTKNLWHCLGACQTGGTAIDWVMRAEGVSFRHAVELLQNDALPLAAASSSSPTPPPKQSTVKKLPMPIEREADDARLLGQVIEYYHQTLLQSPEALEYLHTQIADSLFRTKIGKIFHLAEICEAMAYETKPGAKAVLLIKSEA